MKFLFLYLLLLISYLASGQEFAGKWFSKDRTRIYHIYKKGDEFEAILEKSSRISDKEGVIILRQVIQVGKKKRYKGSIYAADSPISTTAKIRFAEDGRVLYLRLRRMFFINVTIKWYRSIENQPTQLRAPIESFK